MKFSIADTIAARCFAFPERIAMEVLDGSDAVSYGWVWRRICALAQVVEAVQEGRHGPMVGLLLPNGVDAALVYAACQRAGVVAVAINGRLSDRETLAIIEDSDCRLLLSTGEYTTRAQTLCASRGVEVIDLAGIPTPDHAERAPLGEIEQGDKPCVVGYSSGTTGLPKGAVYSNDFYTMNNYRWGWEFGLSSDHVVLVAGPMFHLSYAGFALAALTIGARIRIMPEFEPGLVLDELTEHSSFAFLVPSMLTMVAEEWEKRGQPAVNSARHIISAGAPLPISLARLAMQIFPRAKIAEMYGWTEGSFATYEVKQADTLLPHSVGWPALGADICVFRENGEPCETGEAGEVGVKSGVDFSGYLGQPELTETAWHRGYLMSGDIGIRQPDGRLCIVDRKKDMIITGGENVFTAEVERVLLEHPALLEAAVVGLKDSKWGERVAAMLVLREGASAGEAKIEAFCRQSLAGYKVPRQWEFVDELPRNAMGKVRKNRIVEIMSD
jgi:acyl-CoA synthetase (AMP-forming)/AMP-acid ligase II